VQGVSTNNAPCRRGNHMGYARIQAQGGSPGGCTKVEAAVGSPDAPSISSALCSNGLEDTQDVVFQGYEIVPLPLEVSIYAPMNDRVDCVVDSRILGGSNE